MAEQSGGGSLAVLIDAENTSARYARAVFEEIASLGEANVRRIYGDFSGPRLAGWDTAVQSHAILQHQQRSNSAGKNAADIALVIDAMDLMSKGKVDGFCLITSDSDFTRLAQRLREDGLVVYGFGERKTPEAFRSACTRFIYLENLLDTAEAASTVIVSDASAVAPLAAKIHEPPSKAAPIIRKAMLGHEDEEGWVPLSGVGHRILNIAPDFDSRSFGQAKLSMLIEKSGAFEMKRMGDKNVSIRVRAANKSLAAK
ncbi:NYN domain-containing protein [Rubellimicrobium roseum]|uniref:NYN domain-containing protein n=1 Tax=Rubellimicrobium roseum TaxID=687525 RepID=A0A5C4NA01_9RHOB|nr:NYN domain-containing protein [Rubellimicrobium roseum]TNC59238.1 NYN domain-containing protein [Rubellimicrobium roseum]